MQHDLDNITLSYFEILGINRDEETHSDFIEWFLNPKEGHGLNDYGIRRLLEVCLINKFFKHDLLKTIDEMTPAEKKYGKYRYRKEPELVYNDKKYFILRNWGIKNIDKFIKNITGKIPEFKYEICEK
jgi:hypothetical protein